MEEFDKDGRFELDSRDALLGLILDNLGDGTHWEGLPWNAKWRD